MALQKINQQFLEFIEEKQIDVPENFINTFFTSVTNGEWISSEIAQKYLEYSQKNVLNRALQNFQLDYDYIQITREQYFNNLGLQVNENQQGGQNKKYFMLSPDCFKTMLVIRQSDNGKKYRKFFITLENNYNEFIKQIVQKQNNQNLIKNKKLIQCQQQVLDIQQQLQEKDNTIKQLQQQMKELEDQFDQLDVNQ